MGYDVNIQRLELNAVFDLQGNSRKITKWVKGKLPPFPKKPNTANLRDELALYSIAPERWLLRSAIDNEDRLLEMTQPAVAPVDVSIVQVSDTLRFFAITGPEAGDIISIACSLDHHLSVFPKNGVSYTNFFGIKGLLIRIEDGFEIAVEASYADMIEDFLTRANA